MNDVANSGQNKICRAVLLLTLLWCFSLGTTFLLYNKICNICSSLGRRKKLMRCFTKIFISILRMLDMLDQLKYTSSLKRERVLSKRRLTEAERGRPGTRDCCGRGITCRGRHVHVAVTQTQSREKSRETTEYVCNNYKYYLRKTTVIHL